MNISYQWLHDFLDLEILAPGWQAAADTLTQLGLALEGSEEVDEDIVLDLDVTTNRPDWLSHLGVARELSVHYGLKLRRPDSRPPEAASGEEDCPARVEILDPDLCPRYAARVIAGMEIGPSPDWLRQRLEALGQRPINTIVDITNYVLLEMGHPLHAFDLDRLEGGRVVVRRAREGEALVTLDGQSRILGSEMLAICDASKPVALAGVMGGEFSEISPSTQTMLLESAYFAPASVRQTAKSLGMRTEASFRFERGADPEAPVIALNRATRLIVELTGGRCLGPVLDVNPRPHQRLRVALPDRRLTQVTGIEIEPEFVEKTLAGLEFELTRERAGWEVTVPGFRPDVSLSDDLVEEVLRHYGYNRVPSTYPASGEAGQFLATEAHSRLLNQVVTGYGFRETYNLVFTTPSQEREFTGREPQLVSLANPLSEEDTHLRCSLLPGLLNSVRRNHFHGNHEVRLFERGKVFLVDSEGAPGEAERLGLAVTGNFYETYWTRVADPFAFFHLKGIVECLLEAIGKEAEWKPAEDRPYLHPGISSEVWVDGVSWGCLGRAHPRLQEQWKLTQPVFLAEINLEQLLEHPLRQPHFQPLDRHPAMQRDLSFLVDKDVPFARIEDVIRSPRVTDLRTIHLIDYYHGPKIPDDKVSLTVRLTFVNPERTLTQDEVSQYSDQVFAALCSEVGAQARS